MGIAGNRRAGSWRFSDRLRRRGERIEIVIDEVTRQLAVEYPTQMRVNCICPGTVDSPFVESYLEKYHKDEKVEVRAQLNQRQPIGRLGKPDEIAHMVLYLASDEAGFVQGSILTIDGGWTAA